MARFSLTSWPLRKVTGAFAIRTVGVPGQWKITLALECGHHVVHYVTYPGAAKKARILAYKHVRCDHCPINSIRIEGEKP